MTDLGEYRAPDVFRVIWNDHERDSYSTKDFATLAEAITATAAHWQAQIMGFSTQDDGSLLQRGVWECGWKKRDWK